MKKFIAICIFAIGLMVALPSTASRSGSNSPPGQISYVVEQPTIAPAIVFALVPANFIFVANNQLVSASVVDQEKGGISIWQSQITAPMIYYSNKDVVMSDPFPKLQRIDVIDIRLCYYDVIAARNLKLLQGNKISLLPVTIRKLTQV